MKKTLWILIIVINPILSAQLVNELNNQLVFKKDKEIYVNFDSDIFYPLIQSLPNIKQQMINHNIPCENLTIFCDYIVQEKTIAPLNIVEGALSEVSTYLNNAQIVTVAEESEQLGEIEDYYKKIESSSSELEFLDKDLISKNVKWKKICLLKVVNLIACFLKVKRDLIVCGDLFVGGNQIISGNLTVSGSSIASGCQPGPLTIGTSDATSLNLVTQCTNRLIINGNGAVTINTPAGGETGLTIEGNGETINGGNLTMVAGNVILPVANAGGTQGLLELGGTNATTQVNMYEIGTRNLFAGNGAVNAAVTGTDNISIGTTANSALTAANNTIAIGNAASATATDSLAIGDGANTATARTIVLGSRDSTSTGAAPTASGTNAIAIGSANGTNAGAVASGISSIAVGGAEGSTFTGASAIGDRSIAVGVTANASAAGTVALGSASGTAGGNGAVASNISAIAIGSASLTRAGAIASGISSIAIGGADGTSAVVSNFPGAVASGDRSVAIGVNATSSGAGSIAIGSAVSAGSVAATASNTTAIAIGAASGVVAGASASGLAAVALGGAAAAAGATASGARSVAIGNGANTAQDDAILLGNAAATAVRVGIGIAAPTGKLHVVGANTVVVFRFDQVNTAIGNAPVWLNPSTSAVAGTPIHYDASNRFFGFTSSLRYKTNIRPITTESDVIYRLNPVIYDPKEGYGQGTDIPGFIAEEVYAVAPSLAVLNNNNQPETIAYNSLHALAIKEIQKHQEHIEQQNKIIKSQAATIKKLLDTMKKLQTKMHTLETSAID